MLGEQLKNSLHLVKLSVWPPHRSKISISGSYLRVPEHLRGTVTLYRGKKKGKPPAAEATGRSLSCQPTFDHVVSQPFPVDLRVFEPLRLSC